MIPIASDNSLKEVLREVASSALEVEESARSNPNPQKWQITGTTILPRQSLVG